jgi:hypothetical protein
MAEAMDREKWRAATKANISLCLPKLFSPGDLIGRAVEKRFGAKWCEGCVTQHDRDSRTNEWTWHVECSDGDAGDYNLEEMTRVLIDNGDLDTATCRLITDPPVSSAAKLPSTSAPPFTSELPQTTTPTRPPGVPHGA